MKKNKLVTSVEKTWGDVKKNGKKNSREKRKVMGEMQLTEQKNRRADLARKYFRDFLVRSFQPFLEKLRVAGVQVSSLPGRGSREIRRAVERAPVRKFSLVIIAANGNDMYKKDRIEEVIQHLSVRSWVQ